MGEFGNYVTGLMMLKARSIKKSPLSDLVNMIYKCASLMTNTPNNLKYEILQEDDL